MLFFSPSLTGGVRPRQNVRKLLAILTFGLLGACILPAAVPARHPAKPTSVAAKPVRKTTVVSTSRPTVARVSSIKPKLRAVNVASLRVVQGLARGRARSRRIAWSPWKVPTYADAADGDRIEGDELLVRRAAIEALQGLNGAVVVSDAATGRVLTIVNQKLALRDGFIPCSTVKIPVALAALNESIVERDTPVRIDRRTTMDLTMALAKSNNQYFAGLGRKLGFERMSHYARLFGLGEKAGWNIEGEQAGLLPAAPPRNGMGMMTSFGDGIALTPLELSALVGAIANGGTLYYLQYPRTANEWEGFTPRVKRQLDIGEVIPEIKPGMAGAVEFGTARVIGADLEEPVFGKTGTCTDERSPTHMGWFGSFKETELGKLVVVVMLTGGKGVSGPTAAGVAGNLYRNLEAAGYFVAPTAPTTEASVIPGFPTAHPAGLAPR